MVIADPLNPSRSVPLCSPAQSYSGAYRAARSVRKSERSVMQADDQLRSTSMNSLATGPQFFSDDACRQRAWGRKDLKAPKSRAEALPQGEGRASAMFR